MKKIDHEKLSKKEKVSRQGSERDELTSTGSSADRNRYLEMKYGDGDHKKAPKTTSKKKLEKDEPIRLVVDKNKKTKKYDQRDSYFKGDQIKHAKFGIGNVSNVLGLNSIEVVFRSGVIRLIMNVKETQD